MPHLAAPDSFLKIFKAIVVESTVPDWIPPAMPWEQLEKKFKQKVPARAKRIRGKLNVPRELFELLNLQVLLQRKDDKRWLFAKCGLRPDGNTLPIETTRSVRP